MSGARDIKKLASSLRYSIFWFGVAGVAMAAGCNVHGAGSSSAPASSTGKPTDPSSSPINNSSTSSGTGTGAGATTMNATGTVTTANPILAQAFVTLADLGNPGNLEPLTEAELVAAINSDGLVKNNAPAAAQSTTAPLNCYEEIAAKHTIQTDANGNYAYYYNEPDVLAYVKADPTMASPGITYLTYSMQRLAVGKLLNVDLSKYNGEQWKLLTLWPQV